ncbi:MAG: hypothetical protein HY755_08045 [Nitrospirae bacterium]|nr:hypothetical protein [Nitrospirota bacterium]
MDSDFVLDELQPDDPFRQRQDKTPSEQPDTKNLRERLLKALKEIAHLEEITEDKNTQIAISAKEKDRLIHALHKAFEERKILHDRLADLDILRNMEILELKQGIESIQDRENTLLEENKHLNENILDLEKTIDDLRAEVEKKELELKEAQNDELKERLDSLSSEPAKKTDSGSEQQNEIEEFKRIITELRGLVHEKTEENLSLNNEISVMKNRLEEIKSERDQVVSEYKDKTSRLSADRDSLDQGTKEPSNDEGQAAGYENEGVKSYEKMIYIESRRFGWIKNIGIGIIILILLITLFLIVRR